MRLYVKKVLQLLFVAFLLFVVYLNVNITDLSNDHRGLPWGGDFKINRFQTKPIGVRFHDHGIRTSYNYTATPSVSKKPTPELSVYPSFDHYSEDRIVQQLKFVPPSVRKYQEAGEPVPVKKILVYGGLSGWQIPSGRKLFEEQECKVRDCELTEDRSHIQDADVVLFQYTPGVPGMKRPPSQVWVMFLLESPYHTPSLQGSASLFNWTATYRHDSTIVAPYEKYVPYNDSLQWRTPVRNYAEGKTKQVAWFVSNCGARNGRRQYADELAKHITVDIYGACGTMKCPRFQNDQCFDMLNKQYKFYLAFENSNCRDYITEKFFVNGLK